MSYDVRLKDADGNTVKVDNHEEGGTYALGGTPEAELNVTYNYSKVLNELWGEGTVFLDGKRADRVTKLLRDTVTVLGTERDDDYWKPTEGNVGYALSILLRWAEQYPDATFEVV